MAGPFELVIKNNADWRWGPCGICGEHMSVPPRPALFLDGTDRPVCGVCAAEHDPKLAQLMGLVETALVFAEPGPPSDTDRDDGNPPCLQTDHPERN